MAIARACRDSGINYWPGFVDALSTLVLGIIFLLTVFVVVQFYLTQEVSGKDTLLTRLNAQIAQLTDLLSLEKTDKLGVEEQIAQLRSNIAATENERDRYKLMYDNVGSGAASAQGKVTELTSQLDAESGSPPARSPRSRCSASRLRRCAASSPHWKTRSMCLRRRTKESQTRITDLGQRLNLALAQRVQELSRYRSDFFGRLRTILGNRPDIRIVGDRFVFQSEVFFDSGQAQLNKPEGRAELDKLAAALVELEKRIPGEIAWVLRVDGHTDIRPIVSAAYKSNWELSAARAISVVQHLISKGVSPQRLVAAGFGEFQPIDPETNDAAFGRNRRIELKLTER
jgi:chemotaxis protein MotB